MNTRPNDGRLKPPTPGLFVGCCGLSLVLMGCTFPIYLFEPGGPGLGVYSKTWLWVFAFPPLAASHLGLEPLAIPLLLVNPLIYGLMWTLAWEMFRLCRRPRGED